MSSYYGSISEANTYFSNRLHSESWTTAAADDKPKALLEATRIIDSLRYQGVKHAVWSIMYEYDSTTESYKKILNNPPTRNEVIAADATQELEFPRGQDASVPQEIEWACYEIALAIIEGFDPEDAIERVNVIRQRYASVATTYAADRQSQEYLVYGIPSARVWRWLKPHLAGENPIRISRAD